MLGGNWKYCVLLGATPALLFSQATIGGCPVFPADNVWNTKIDHLPVQSNSSTLVSTIGTAKYIHADFGAGLWDGGPIGIPFITVPGTQQKFPATFLYWDESDPGPYAVPLNAPIEGGSSSNGDRHAIAIDTDNCILYELYRAFPQASSWQGDSGAIYNLLSHALRPLGWTSADAAGLAIMPGLVTWEEVAAGEIKHAIRLTVPQTKREYVWPARHYASSLTGTQYSPMGQRFRLKADFDISGFPADVRVILTAMKTYGLILADNGSAWFLSGKPDDRWNNDNLRRLHDVLGSNLEAVDGRALMIDVNSGQAQQPGPSVPVISTVSPSPAPVGTFTLTVNGSGFTSGSQIYFDSVATTTAFVSGNQLTASVTTPGPASNVPVQVRRPDNATSNIVTVNVVAPVVSVTISPTSANLRFGKTRQFAATVTGSANTSVTWLVGGVVGGSAATGTISASGLYKAPNVAVTTTVTARSNADPAKSASATVKVSKTGK